MSAKVFLDLHVLQTIPPNCLNRDDTGSPKTAMYGGVRRARVSSQAWKRAMRLHFNEEFDSSKLSIRTKCVFDLIAEEIVKKSPELSSEEAQKKAIDALTTVGLKASGKTPDEKKLDALFFISSQQVKNIAALACGEVTAKDVKAALKADNGVDLALFGRMVATDPSLNCEASAQVAHAISTHLIENEYDFYTAVDDYAKDLQEHAGAGMMGTIEYNSATLYRYATVAAHELYKQLNCESDALDKTIAVFTKAFVCSIPTGRQNTFAAHTMPDALLAAIRVDRPLNLVGAFEKPVKGEGLLSESASAFEKYAKSVYADFCSTPAVSYVVGNYFNDLGKRLSLDDLLTVIGSEVAMRCL